MIQSKIKIRTKNKSYNVIVGNNLTNNLKDNLIKFNKCLLVIDCKVPIKLLRNIYFSLRKKKKFKYIFNSSEINKNQKTINKLLDILLKNNFHRNDCLISIGGGITGDVSSFAANILKEG